VPVIECGFQNPPAAGKPDPAEQLELIGPTVSVDIGFDPTLFGQALPPIPGSSIPPSAVPAVSVPALLDTGAHESCIDEVLAQQLNLPLIDRQPISGVGGQTVVNVYLAHISIPGLIVQYGRFTGVYLSAGGQFHKALIGRTLLRDALLVYDGVTGSVRLAR
jgi:hypothetical protein